MPSAILVKFLAAVEPAISLASLGNGAGRISAVVDNSVVRASRGILAVKIKTGTTPTNNSAVRFYLIRQTNDGVNNVKGGGGALGDLDAAVTAEPMNAPLCGEIIVSSTTGASYAELYMVYDPGPKFSVVVWNASGVSLNVTPDTPAVQWLPIADEAQ